jgi:iron complex outermembrane receptor protein
MNKFIFIAPAIFLMSSSSLAEELTPIIVESTAFSKQSVNDFAQSVEILKGEELERKKTTTIGQTVKDELGVTSTYFAPGSSRPIIRGLGSNRVRVMENSIDSLDVSNVSADHAVTVNPYISKQIEILRGPASLLYGPGAIGGVVNVINDRIPQTLDRSLLDYNLYTSYDIVSDGKTGSAELNGVVDSFAWHIDGFKQDTNDYDINGYANEELRENKGTLKNSDLETDNYSFGVSHISDQGLAGISYSRFDTNYGVPGALEGDIRIDLKQYRYDSLFEIYDLFSGLESLKLRSTYNNYRHYEIEEDGEIATTFRNKEFESRLEALHSLGPNWNNTYGLQYNDIEFSSVGEEAFVEPVDSNRYGGFGITQYETSNWNLEAGARVDYTDYDPDTNSDKDFTTFSLSLGAINAINDDLSLSIYAAHSERAPDAVALYADGPHLATITFEIGDDDLDSEKSNNIELSLKMEKPNYSWAFNTYYNYIDDYIYLDITGRSDEDGNLDPNGEFLFGNWDNESAEFYGFEAEFVAPIIQNNKYNVEGRVFSDYVRARFRDGGDVPRIPQARLGFGLDSQYGMWTGAADLTFVGEQNNTADFETDTDSYTMLNAGISRVFERTNADIILSLKGENLLDEDARQSTSFQKDRVPLPGRNVNFSLTLRNN